MADKMVKPHLFDVIEAPVVSEKSTMASQNNTYFFKVDSRADKRSIKESVEQVFKVTVEKVNTLTLKGKTKYFKGRKGRRTGYKKAMVRLKSGDVIEFGAKVS